MTVLESGQAYKPTMFDDTAVMFSMVEGLDYNSWASSPIMVSGKAALRRIHRMLRLKSTASGNLFSAMQSTNFLI